MKITKEEIKALNPLNPCRSGWKWYLENQEEDLLKLLLNANNNNPADARWLFTKLMTKEQCIKIAIYSARQVLHIFEDKYPEDKRPRKAIESAENYLKDPSEENKKAAAYAAYVPATYAAYAAAYAAYAAAYAAYAAYAPATYAAAAADAAAAAADAAAAAAAYAVYAPATYAAYAKKELQEKIIIEAVRILEEV